MRVRLLLVMLALLAAQSAALAQSKLLLKSFTASPGGFAVNSTLVYGDKDAILIDAQFAQSDTHRLVAEIIETGRNLTTVYVTHAHPDHYFGFGVIKQAFPHARIVALPSVVKGIQATAESKVKQWKLVFGDNVTASPIIPEPLQGTILAVEGETLQIVGGVQGDAPDSSYVWIPSLNAAVAGDIAFSGIFPWTAETTPTLRKEWIKVLDEIAARNPAIVVAGHNKPQLKDDASSLRFTREYLVYFDQALASSKTPEELSKKIKAKYPDLGLDVILKIASDAAFAGQK
jgi:glyoxylase-like metal-dependent hydrolase (beta-lactamase superfamily II)